MPARSRKVRRGAGKAVDKTVESAGQQLEKAGQSIQDAAKDAKK